MFSPVKFFIDDLVSKLPSIFNKGENLLHDGEMRSHLRYSF